MPPKRDWKLRISDILGAIARIRTYTDGMTLEQFQADGLAVDAVCWNFGVIGEATSHVPADVISANRHVPWGDMRAMRNFVVHVYFGVNVELLWETLHYDLPPLVAPLKEILAKAA